MEEYKGKYNEIKSRSKFIRLKILELLMEPNRYGFSEIYNYIMRDYKKKMSYETLSGYLNDLEKKGFIKKEEGKRGKYSITNKGREEFNRLIQIEQTDLLTISHKGIIHKGGTEISQGSMKDINNPKINITSSASELVQGDLKEEYEHLLLRMAKDYSEWMREHNWTSGAIHMAVIQPKQKIPSLEDL
jgi:DNA-binding PadR family transcriptional regulator